MSNENIRKTNRFRFRAAQLAWALLVALVAFAGAPTRVLAEGDAASGTITVLHVNDTHGNYALDYVVDPATEEEIQVNAYAVLAGIANGADPDTTIVLDAGDTFHGNSFATVSEGESIATLMDAAGVVATTPGNHDWSYGADRLAELDTDHDLSVLAANVVDATTGEPFFDQSYELVDLEVAGEPLTVGIVGAIDESFYTSTPAANVEGLAFTDPVATATDAAAEAREAGADIVVCLSHNTDPEGFAAEISGVDAVVAGHEHVTIDETVTAADGREVAVVEVPSSPADDYFGTIGSLTLDVAQDAAGTWSATQTESSQIDTASNYEQADAAGKRGNDAQHQGPGPDIGHIGLGFQTVLGSAFLGYKQRIGKERLPQKPEPGVHGVEAVSQGDEIKDAVEPTLIHGFIPPLDPDWAADAAGE